MAVRMVREGDPIGQGLASLSSCPHCGSQLLEGDSFCCQCGSHFKEAEPIAPETEVDARRPDIELGIADESLRFTPHSAGEANCRFCRGPLDLSGEFCEQCGAPVTEAAPSRWRKPAESTPPVVPKLSSPPAPSAACQAVPPAVKATSSPATRSYAASPFAPPHPEGKPSGTRPPNTVTAPKAGQLKAPSGKPAKPATTSLVSPPPSVASPPAPIQETAVQAFVPQALAAESLKSFISQLPKTLTVPLHPAATPLEIAGPLPGTIPIVPLPPSLPVRQEAVLPAQPRRPFPLVIAGGIVGSLLAIGLVAGWYLLHRNKQSARVGNVTTQQLSSPALPVATTTPDSESENTPAPASALPEEIPQAPAPARKPRRVRAAPAATPAPVVTASDRNSAELVRLQNLAREAYAKGNYAEPRDACAIAYAKQALVLDPSNNYTWTLFEDSIKGGKYQVQQAIVSKDFATAHRIADVLGQLLAGGSGVADLKADIASAEKAEEESRHAKQVPVATLSFRVYHMHSGKAPGDKGSYCRGTLSVVAGRLKYVGETAQDGQVHSFDFACSEVLEVKKNFRVASRENGFHVRTASSNINFVPEDASASHIPALASGCSK